MGLSGLVGAGVQDEFARMIAQALLERQQGHREATDRENQAIARQRLAQDAAQHQASIDLQNRALRDRANAAGVEDMLQQRAVMDREEAQTVERDRTASKDRAVSNLAGLMPLVDRKSASGRAEILGQLSRIDPKAAATEMLAPTPEEEDARALTRYEAQERIQAKYRPGTAAERDQQWVVRNGKVTPIQKGTAQSGDVPYDAVAERQNNKPTDNNVQQTATEIARVAKALRGHRGLGGAFGVMDATLPTFRQSTADAEVLRDSLRALLTLDNMDLMKGVLSETDMKIIQSASTTLSNRMSDAAARAELDRIIPIMEKAAGAGGAGAPKVGDTKTFPNGKTGRFDGRGWVLVP